MSKEAEAFISQERMAQIKELPELHQKYLLDIYTHALNLVDDEMKSRVVAMLDHDIQTLQTQEDPRMVAFNEKREAGFAELVQKIQRILEEDPSGEKLERWLAGALNNIFKFKDDMVLYPRDFSSARIVFVTSATQAVITRIQAPRPILVFDDPKQLEKIMDRFGGGESTNGMFVPISGRGDLAEHIAPGYTSLARAGLLLSRKGREDTMGHEIRHSIDPLVKARKGFDEILTELFAFATQVGLRRDVLTRMLNHPAYLDQNLEYEKKQDENATDKGYSKNSYFGIEAKTEEVHKLFVETALDTFFADCEKMGVIKALRRLGKSADLQSYFPISAQMKLRRLV